MKLEKSWNHFAAIPSVRMGSAPVSYTHLDVYKRQAVEIEKMSFVTRTRENYDDIDLALVTASEWYHFVKQLVPEGVPVIWIKHTIDPVSYTHLTCLLMLDTCQYEPRNQVGGMIKTETYEWIEQQLDEAEEAGMRVLPVADVYKRQGPDRGRLYGLY